MADIPASRMRVDTPQPLLLETTDEDPLAAALVAIQDNIFSGESLEAVFRCDPPGLSLLAISNKRLMMVDKSTFEDLTALTSVPLGGVSSVSFVMNEGETLDTTRTVGLVISRKPELVVCQTRQEARELHDMMIWTPTS